MADKEKDRPQTVEEREARREELRRERWQEQQEQMREDVENHDLTKLNQEVQDEYEKRTEEMFKERDEQRREEEKRQEEEEKELGPEPAFHTQPEQAYYEQQWGSGTESAETTQNVGTTEPRRGSARKGQRSVEGRPEDKPAQSSDANKNA